jgi:hypothetical protein
MENNFKLLVQLPNWHLRLIPRGTINDLGVKQILRVTEAGLRMFPVVIVDLQETGEFEENSLTILEKGLQQLIAQRGQVILQEKYCRRIVINA